MPKATNRRAQAAKPRNFGGSGKSKPRINEQRGERFDRTDWREAKQRGKF